MNTSIKLHIIGKAMLVFLMSYYPLTVSPSFKPKENWCTKLRWCCASKRTLNNELFKAINQGNKERVAFLLRCGADINAYNSAGNTPLLTALEKSQVEIANLLLDHNAIQPGLSRRPDGTTALHLAAARGCEEAFILKLLQKLNNTPSFINALNSEDETPLSVALDKSQLEVAKVLLQSWYKVNTNQKRRRDGATALHLAIPHNNNSLIYALLRNNASSDENDDEGYTPLQRAVLQGQEKIVEILLGYNPDVNIIAQHTGDTPLHSAIKSGRADIVKMLLTASPDLSLRNQDGYTPYEAAVRGTTLTHSREDIIRIFKEEIRKAQLEIEKADPLLYQDAIASHRESSIERLSSESSIGSLSKEYLESKTKPAVE